MESNVIKNSIIAGSGGGGGGLSSVNDYTNASNGLNKLANLVLNKQHNYISNILKKGNTTNLHYVITPDLVNHYNHIHETIRSELKSIPGDLCTLNGGYMCTNIKLLNVGEEEGGDGGNGTEGQQFNTLKNNYDLKINRKDALENDGTNETLKVAIDVLDSINIARAQSTVDVKSEFADNLFTIGNIFKSKIDEFKKSLVTLNGQLLSTKQELSVCNNKRTQVDDANSILSKTNEYKRMSDFYRSKYDECQLYIKTIMDASRKDAESISSMSVALNTIREQLYTSYDARLKHLYDMVTELIQKANKNNEELLVRLRNQSEAFKLIDENVSATSTNIVEIPYDDDHYDFNIGDIERMRQEIELLKSQLRECEEGNDTGQSTRLRTANKELKKLRSTVRFLSKNSGAVYGQQRIQQLRREEGERGESGGEEEDDDDDDRDEYENNEDRIDYNNMISSELTEEYDRRVERLIGLKRKIYSEPPLDVLEISKIPFIVEDTVAMALASRNFIITKYNILANKNLSRVMLFMNAAEKIIARKNRIIELLKDRMIRNNVDYEDLFREKSEILESLADERARIETDSITALNNHLKELNDTLFTEIAVNKDAANRLINPVLSEIIHETSKRVSIAHDFGVNMTEQDLISRIDSVLEKNEALEQRILVLERYEALYRAYSTGEAVEAATTTTKTT